MKSKELVPNWKQKAEKKLSTRWTLILTFKSYFWQPIAQFFMSVLLQTLCKQQRLNIYIHLSQKKKKNLYTCVCIVKKKSQQKIKNKKTYRKCAEKEILSTAIKAEQDGIKIIYIYIYIANIFFILFCFFFFLRISRSNILIVHIRTFQF